MYDTVNICIHPHRYDTYVYIRILLYMYMYNAITYEYTVIFRIQGYILCQLLILVLGQWL